MADYPLIKPDTINIKTLPTYGVKILELSNLKEKRYTINIGNDFIINFNYSGLNTQDTLSIINFYEQQKGELTSFNIPLNVFYDKDIFNTMITLLNPESKWRFNTQINTQTRVIGIYAINFELKGVFE
jgi:hypothetical protein